MSPPTLAVCLEFWVVVWDGFNCPLRVVQLSLFDAPPAVNHPSSQSNAIQCRQRFGRKPTRIVRKDLTEREATRRRDMPCANRHELVKVSPFLVKRSGSEHHHGLNIICLFPGRRRNSSPCLLRLQTCPFLSHTSHVKCSRADEPVIPSR